jgi:hypothetical protein
MPATLKKPAPAKHGTCRWTYGNDSARRDLLAGLPAELLMRPDGAPEWTCYTLQAEIGPEGLAGWTLTRWDDGGRAVYHLAEELDACTCPDRKHCPGREGGCKHMAGVAAALERIGLDPRF